MFGILLIFMWRRIATGVIMLLISISYIFFGWKGSLFTILIVILLASLRKFIDWFEMEYYSRRSQ